MAPKRGLGKGLDSLIPNSVDTKEVVQNTETAEKPDRFVDINKLEPNREQPRKNFDQEALAELADSIKKFGLIQPILVQDRDSYYEIVAGERRWRASKLAGLKEVPVIIRKFTEQEIVEISLIENIQREDLNPIEEALAYKRLHTEFNLKQDEVADRVSKSRAAVANSMRLLKLAENVQQMVIDGEISTGHARALLAIEDENEQYRIALKVYNEKMSVRDVEKLIKNLGKPESGYHEFFYIVHLSQLNLFCMFAYPFFTDMRYIFINIFLIPKPYIINIRRSSETKAHIFSTCPVGCVMSAFISVPCIIGYLISVVSVFSKDLLCQIIHPALIVFIRETWIIVQLRITFRALRVIVVTVFSDRTGYIARLDARVISVNTVEWRILLYNQTIG